MKTKLTIALLFLCSIGMAYAQSEDDSITIRQKVIRVDASKGPVTITIPKEFTYISIKKTDPTRNIVSVRDYTSKHFDSLKHQYDIREYGLQYYFTVMPYEFVTKSKNINILPVKVLTGLGASRSTSNSGTLNYNISPSTPPSVNYWTDTHFYSLQVNDLFKPLMTVSHKDPKTGEFKVWFNKSAIVWTSDSTFILKTKIK